MIDSSFALFWKHFCEISVSNIRMHTSELWGSLCSNGWVEFMRDYSWKVRKIEPEGVDSLVEIWAMCNKGIFSGGLWKNVHVYIDLMDILGIYLVYSRSKFQYLIFMLFVYKINAFDFNLPSIAFCMWFLTSHKEWPPREIESPIAPLKQELSMV